MQERGYKALLVIVSVVVVVALFVAYSARGNMFDVLLRADSLLVHKPNNQLDSTFAFAPSRPQFGRKSRRVLYVELNSADSAALCQVYGIGPAFASRIVRRREELGGFFAVEQLREVYGIDEGVYERIAKNFFVDSALIQKINVNFANRKMLTSHPYITASMAKRIEQARTKGGYITSRKELIDRNILLPKEALRVAPYFVFKTTENR